MERGRNYHYDTMYLFRSYLKIWRIFDDLTTITFVVLNSDLDKKLFITCSSQSSSQVRTKKTPKVLLPLGFLKFSDEKMRLHSGSLVEWVLFYLLLLHLVHLRTSDLASKNKANSNLGTSFIVYLDWIGEMTSF